MQITQRKEIPLGRADLTCLVDAADYEYLSQWKWHLRSGYPCRAKWLSRNPPKRTYIQMHRVILNPSADKCIDHINGNTCDNRRENLRICTHIENSRNRAITGGSSQFKGVTHDKNSGRWYACIRVDGTLLSLGYFECETEAAQCYNAAATEYFKEFARLNPVPMLDLTWQQISVAAIHRYNEAKYSSKYIGVSFSKNSGRWIATISSGASDGYLGIFDDEKTAALCADAAIVETHGNDRPRNFMDIPVTKTPKEIVAALSKKTSAFVGVKATGKKWSAQLVTKGKEIYLGTFDDELAAAKARDKYVIDNSIKRVKINLPLS